MSSIHRTKQPVLLVFATMSIESTNKNRVREWERLKNRLDWSVLVFFFSLISVSRNDWRGNTDTHTHKHTKCDEIISLRSTVQSVSIFFRYARYTVVTEISSVFVRRRDKANTANSVFLPGQRNRYIENMATSTENFGNWLRNVGVPLRHWCQWPTKKLCCWRNKNKNHIIFIHRRFIGGISVRVLWLYVICCCSCLRLHCIVACCHFK